MEFIVKDSQGNEAGPLSRKEVEQWIMEGKITGKTQIRYTLLNKWSKVKEIQLFTETLAIAARKIAPAEQAETGKLGRLFHKPKWEEEEEEEKTKAFATAFKNIVEPVPAGFILRTLSAVFDTVIIIIVAAMLTCLGLGELFVAAKFNTTFAERNQDEKEQLLQKRLVELHSETAADLNSDAKKKAPEVPKPKPETSDEGTDEDSAKEGEKAKEKAPQSTEGLKIERKDNLEATTAPSTVDNRLLGYLFGSVWLDTTSNTKYCCIFSTDDTGLWVPAQKIESVWERYFIIFCFAFFLYFGLGLGLYAQTVGMWFWGTFICKPDGAEVYLFRCFLFTLLMVPLGVLMPIFTILFRGRALHDLLTGIKIVRTSGSRQY